MTFCKDTSQNVLELRKETNENILRLRQEASAQAEELRKMFLDMTRIINLLTHIPETTVEDEDSCATSDQSDNMSVQSHDTTKHGTSPRKKKDKRRRKHLNLASITKNHNPTYDQDPSATNKQKTARLTMGCCNDYHLPNA
jgi:hypothetical protein